MKQIIHLIFGVCLLLSPLIAPIFLLFYSVRSILTEQKGNDDEA